MKKTVALLLLAFWCMQALAQQLSGVVTDKSTGLPVAGATVFSSHQTTFTNFAGRFNISKLAFGDTIKIRYLGYKPYNMVINAISVDTIRITIEQSIISLGTVTINGYRDIKADSLKTRQDFASVFSHKAPTLKDIFVTRSPYSSSYHANNTSEILSFNVLAIIALLTKRSDPISHLQKILIADEENNYIDQRFTKQEITRLTNLKNDSLQNFIYEYRPSITEIKKMSDYDLIQYIKKSYQAYTRPGRAITTSPFTN